MVSAAALVLVGTAVALPWTPLGADREPEPASPDGMTDSQRVALLLAEPDARVDADATWVSDGGAVLQRVTTSSPVGEGCEADRRAALVWRDLQGDRRAWSHDVAARDVLAVQGGFVVGAVPPTCARELGPEAGRAGAYTVAADGETRAVQWSDDAAQEQCATAPATPGCLVDAATGKGSFVDGARAVPGAGFLALDGTAGADRWAASTDGRVLAWTQDGGRTWQRHRTALVPGAGDGVQSAAAGPVAVFFAWPRAEVTRDRGRTWQVQDLEQALSPVLVANPVFSVTADGVLLGVSYPASGRPFVFASTDATWARFVPSDFRTQGGDYDLRTSGSWAWNEDRGSVWLSRDGLTWREVDTVLSPGSG
jgi:hypothetical protein